LPSHLNLLYPDAIVSLNLNAFVHYSLVCLAQQVTFNFTVLDAEKNQAGR